MGRWTQYDEDSHRLPEGFTRTAYDADTQKYTFTDAEGGIWEGAERAEFSEMTRVSGPSGDGDDDLEAAAPGTYTRRDGYQELSSEPGKTARPYRSTPAYRTIFPFFLIIAVALLLVWRLIIHPASSPPPSPCPTNIGIALKPYTLKSGDTCWDISSQHGTTVEKMKEINRGLDCDLLKPGRRVCLPAPKR